MSRTKNRWTALEEIPEEAQRLLLAFHRIMGLHHTNNVVREAIGGSNAMVIIQVYGRMTAGQLQAIEREGQCRVEIEARAPNHLWVMLFSYCPESPVPGPRYLDQCGHQFLSSKVLP